MWRFLVLLSLSHKVFWVRCGTNCIDSSHLPSSLLFILTRVPTHKKYCLLRYPLRSNSGWLPIRCAYFILMRFVKRGAKPNIVSEYDQKIARSQTADKPVASRGRATRKTNKAKKSHTKTCVDQKYKSKEGKDQESIKSPETQNGNDRNT